MEILKKSLRGNISSNQLPCGGAKDGILSKARRGKSGQTSAKTANGLFP